MVRDNVGLYGARLRHALRTMGIRDSPTQPHSPWQSGHIERLIGSIRREAMAGAQRALEIPSVGRLARSTAVG